MKKLEKDINTHDFTHTNIKERASTNQYFFSTTRLLLLYGQKYISRIKILIKNTVFTYITQ